jgi:hypothetical protein
VYPERMSVGSDESSGPRSPNRNDESTAEVHNLVRSNRRLNVREASEEMDFLMCRIGSLYAKMWKRGVLAETLPRLKAIRYGI